MLHCFSSTSLRRRFSQKAEGEIPLRPEKCLAAAAVVVAAAVVLSAYAAAEAVSAAGEQQDEDDNPPAATKTVIAIHIQEPPV